MSWLSAGPLTWRRAVDRSELLAPSTTTALAAWAAADPAVADEVLVAEIDPDLADTAALTQAYRLPLAASCNCVLVSGRRDGQDRAAGAVVRATGRADVNNAVKRLLDVRKASFLPMAQAVADAAMEYGGITPIGLPAGYRVLVDAAVTVPHAEAGEMVVIGSGLRRSKIALPGALLGRAPSVEVIEGLALG